jgi:hypothetical protein
MAMPRASSSSTRSTPTPSWQRRIGLFLRECFSAIQFIVTTHSPLVCQAAEVGTLFQLPCPGSSDEGRMVTGTELDRLLHGDLVEAYDTVRAVLTEMCSGADRCMYCEDSAADEIEHVRPKSLYPDQTFVWENYLYACGRCNGPKSNSLGVLGSQRRAVVAIERRRGEPITPPEPGRMLLIDPRREDPPRFPRLDTIAGKFRCNSKPSRPGAQWLSICRVSRTEGVSL